HLRLLPLVWMGATCINFELFDHLPPQFVVWQHPFDGEFDHTLWMFVHHFAQTDCAEATRILRVTVEELGVELIACNGDFRSIDDDHKVASIDMWRESGFVLAAKDVGDTSSETPQVQPCCIDHIPRPLNRSCCGCVGLESHFDLDSLA